MQLAGLSGAPHPYGKPMEVRLWRSHRVVMRNTGHVIVVTRLDQDDFWLNQPKIINLIDSKVLEQLYGFI